MKKLITTAILAVMLASPAQARDSLLGELNNLVHGSATSVPASGTMEVAFSPDQGAEQLVLKVINAAKRTLRVQAYSFTSSPVVSALLAAKKRGVDVQIVVDQKSNTSDDRSGKAGHALQALVNAGVPVRIISVYAIHHDKVIVADSETVETGSFNYSDAAAHKNSENVLVIWGNPNLAHAYTSHWQSRFNQGSPYNGRY